MRFMLMHRVHEDDPTSWEPNPELIERMNTFIGKLNADGVMLGAEGVLKPGAVVRRRGAAIKSTDGPFAEAKEVVGGFLLVNAKDLAEATAIAEEYITCFAGVEEMSIEVRRVTEFEDIEPYLTK
ncbi:YciI family protein [Lentzea sp. NBC_00516]|uniref:YciI family protein n=1 Tax=Lentzea sp. NBC_00516 TaxID=2903582 RepID=UPI002E823044|nr:YciI family protein [Lentzea sp. NBC_00516]WUD28288.1 YciI family protein [Lentzea sp. NBC_00516]